MVESSPKILGSEEKATTITTKTAPWLYTELRKRRYYIFSQQPTLNHSTTVMCAKTARGETKKTTSVCVRPVVTLESVKYIPATMNRSKIVIRSEIAHPQ